MSRRVKPVQDQRMKRRRAVIVGSSSDNGQSRTVLERPHHALRRSVKFFPKAGAVHILDLVASGVAHS
jgi:hypothetical protein